MPDSVLLFGTYDELQIVTPGRTEAIKPPMEVGYNHGYFAFPSISPRGDLVAWGFARESRKDRSDHPVRFTLGLFSLTEKKWNTNEDLDDIGATVFSPDGSKVAFVAELQNKRDLLIFDIAKKATASVPYPRGMPESASLSWSPDAKQLAVEIQQWPKNSFVAVLDLDTGHLQSLGEGFDPAWSPNGDWIAYFDPSGTRCLVVHPDGTGTKVVKTVRQLWISYRRFGFGGPVWSPDSRQLLLSEMKGDDDPIDVVLLDVASGRETRK